MLSTRKCFAKTLCFIGKKNKAISLAHAAGVQFPRNVPSLNGFVRSISENKDLVNNKFLSQTETIKNEEYAKNILREGNVRYTKNNESIETLLGRRRQLPKTMASDAFNKIIKQYEEFVNPQIFPTDKGSMSADRAMYMTARELLLQAMEDEELKAIVKREKPARKSRPCRNKFEKMGIL